ncbi:MAG: biopolymer transporter ExbD [Thermoguttaceae bacterium]|nr:biopolymer transporter ExbD [Thermoguttaceae bacterium]
MRRSNSAGELDGRPNLTPILDMVFQLITFFMLVINFKAASVDMSLNLPVIGSARPVDARGIQSLLILNVNKEGSVSVYGQRVDIEGYLAREAQVERKQLKHENPSFTDSDELRSTVVIRADREIAFRDLNHVIRECQKNGYLKYALKAMNREE